VVGDQSSGKSSVLESLTGFSFPQSPVLCTRYATQISCRRVPESSVSISIIPRPDANVATMDRLRSFKRTAPALTNAVLLDVIGDANHAMGIRMTTDDMDPNLQAFSQDVLKIEVNGPEQEHFTVIDVPDIFRFASPPLTRQSDILLVRNMVEAYTQHSRTVILAVLPSNADISTQEILKIAEDADPDGIRTMGVLTKPDLVTETTTRDIIKDLVLGNRNRLRLGYCIVKNRSADDMDSSLPERICQERAFFNNSSWNAIATSGRCGVESLKIRLSELLMTITKREFPNVKSDVAKRLDCCRSELDSIGPSRNDHAAQRMFLGKISTEFKTATERALNANYDGESVFSEDPSLKLITNVTKMNERFANVLWTRGHKRHTSIEWVSEGESSYNTGDDNDDDPKNSVQDLVSSYPELEDVIDEADYIPKSKGFR
jgi:GTPase SAR1 family protein